MSIVLDSQRYIPSQRDELREEIDGILDDFFEPLSNFTIAQEIRSLADAANIPREFAENIKIRKTGKNQGEVRNTWGSKDKPLAAWFNYGTPQHWIEPKKEDGVLAWPASEGSHAHAIYFQGDSKEGDTLFSGGHYVSGIPKTEVMERGFETGKKRLYEEAKKIVEQELDFSSVK